jgi:leukotriene-A4 hydrolase
VQYVAEKKEKIYFFNNEIPMANYLIAMAVGDLEYRSLGRRVGVITEPSMLDKVANELDKLEQLVDEAEKYLTPYIWGNYSILVLPPSFPVGGMENPLLTFASPTIITGDKSQVYVATHEIAHSWTGNDVTCRNWEDFWLNEGFTVFEERKVSAKLYGEEFAKVEAFLGNISMYDSMKEYGLDNVYSSLHTTLKGDNPDSAFSEVPYEKGFQLLTYLESFVGEELFQNFLRYYIIRYTETSIISHDLRASWEDFVEDNFNASMTNQILGSINWDQWIYTPGLPPAGLLNFTTDAQVGASKLADDYIALAGASSPADYAKFKDYYSNLKVVFLERLNERFSDLTLALIQKIDADLSITNSVDPEVKQRWLPLGLKLSYTPVLEVSHTWVSEVGRMKYLRPIYITLRDTNQKDLAI